MTGQSKRNRVIEILRKHYDGPWRYIGSKRWQGPTFAVVARGEALYREDTGQRLMIGTVGHVTSV